MISRVIKLIYREVLIGNKIIIDNKTGFVYIYDERVLLFLLNIY